MEVKQLHLKNRR